MTVVALAPVVHLVAPLTTVDCNRRRNTPFLSPGALQGSLFGRTEDCRRNERMCVDGCMNCSATLKIRIRSLRASARSDPRPLCFFFIAQRFRRRLPFCFHFLVPIPWYRDDKGGSHVVPRMLAPKCWPYKCYLQIVGTLICDINHSLRGLRGKGSSRRARLALGFSK